VDEQKHSETGGGVDPAGHRISHAKVGQLLEELGYSLHLPERLKRALLIQTGTPSFTISTMRLRPFRNRGSQ